MTAQSFLNRLCHSLFRPDAFTRLALVVLACSNPAFCDAIHDAARDGDLAKVQALLKDHPDLVSSKDSDGSTPLLLAAAKDRKDIVVLLLANKAEVNAKDYYGRTPLLVAAANNHKDVMEVLLSDKADVNTKDYNGDTPLCFAAYYGHKQVAELLLANDADVNAKAYTGFTPVCAAVATKHNDVLALLREHGGQPLSDAACQQSVDVRFLEIEKIVILPVIDARSDTKIKVDLQDMRKNMQKILERKKYAVVQADTPPPGDRWFVVSRLTDLHGLPPVASVVGFLCDVQSKDPSVLCAGNGGLLWFGAGYGGYTSAQAGIQGPAMMERTAAQLTDLTFLVFMPGVARKDTLGNALFNLLSGFPSMPKNKK